MALFFIGLGLGNARDMTLRGVELMQQADKVYLESYTSVLQCKNEDIEKIIKKKIFVAERIDVENGAEALLQEVKTMDVALLVFGDPFVATTHVDLFLEAKKRGIRTEVVHNASILSAIGETGLQVYKFGRTVSIPFQEDALTFFDGIMSNQKEGLHTLVLLDLDPKEKKFLSISEAIVRMKKAEAQKKKKVCSGVLVGCARLGAKDAKIMTGSVSELQKENWGNPPYCLVIPGKLHFVEEEALEIYRKHV